MGKKRIRVKQLAKNRDIAIRIPLPEKPPKIERSKKREYLKKLARQKVEAGEYEWFEW